MIVAGCGDDSGNTAPDFGFTLSTGADTVKLTQSGTAGTFVKAIRSGGFSGAVTYVITGAPTGLVTGIASTSTADSSRLTVTASGTLAAGTYSLIVTATAPGVPTRQATVRVTVAATTITSDIKLIVAGTHTCALTTAGKAYCWGYNAKGQLGNNDTSIVNPTPVAVVGGLAFQSISVSNLFDFTCGLTAAGAAYCWGDNAQSFLGDGTTTQRLTPTAVVGGIVFQSLVIGGLHVCGIATNGTVWCWGRSISGATGSVANGSAGVPAVAVTGMTFQSLVAGYDYTCGLTPTGAAYCWGLGNVGQLGNGNVSNSSTPIPVSGALTFRSLAAGGMSTCGLTLAGKAYCWGHNVYGTVGDGASSATGRLVPVAVAGGLTFQSISVGFATTCGVTDSGKGYCWGHNNYGANGDGTLNDQSVPTAVAGELTFQSIANGSDYTCGVTTGHQAFCWGDNNAGQLGDGTIELRKAPTAVRWPTGIQ